jgi:Zn-dependent peptidase ImmA (M78 family)
MIVSAKRKQLAQEAIQLAMQVRIAAKVPALAPVSPVDACERLGLAVWFSDIPSMEGIYVPNAQPKPAIVISALRPRGRQSMTCGHELGHHAFGHGEQWDELIEDRNDARRFEPAEYQADLFSACFHMPKLAM